MTEVVLKGCFVVLEKEIQTQDLNIYNINEVIIPTQRYLFCPQLNTRARSIWSLFEARKVAGSAKIRTK